MRTLDEVRTYAMQLSDEDRMLLAQELVGSVEPSAKWWDDWTAEADRRYQRIASGEERGLTLEEFWSDDEP